MTNCGCPQACSPCTFAETELDDISNTYNYDVTGQFVLAKVIHIHFDYTPFLECEVTYRLQIYANTVLIYDSGAVCDGTEIDTIVEVPAGTTDIDATVTVATAGAETDWLFDIYC